MDIAQLIQTVAIYALPLLFAITVHEAAHGYAARYFGDNTAWKMGRLSLNPIHHIDPIGTILLPLLTFLGGFPIGYAKPVPVRFGNLRNPKRDMIWVALAGPAANLVQAFLWGLLLILLNMMGVEEVFFSGMCKVGVGVNLSLMVLNLFPLPPLDGGRVLVGLLPMQQAMAFSRIEPYGFFIVIGLIYLRILDTYWMRPLISVFYSLLNVLLSPFTMLLS